MVSASSPAASMAAGRNMGEIGLQFEVFEVHVVNTSSPEKLAGRHRSCREPTQAHDAGPGLREATKGILPQAKPREASAEMLPCVPAANAKTCEAEHGIGCEARGRAPHEDSNEEAQLSSP